MSTAAPGTNSYNDLLLQVSHSLRTLLTYIYICMYPKPTHTPNPIQINVDIDQPAKHTEHLGSLVASIPRSSQNTQASPSTYRAGECAARQAAAA